MGRRLAALLMALLLLWPTGVFAAGTDLDSLKQQRTALTGQLDVVKGEEAAVLTELFNLNRSLDQIQQQIGQTQAGMEKVEAQLQATARQENELQEKYKTRLAEFGRRVRFMVERGPASYFELLFNASDLQDFIWRLSILQAMIRRDAALLSDVRNLRRQAAAKEAELQAQRRQLAELSGRLLDEQQKLQETIQTRNDRLAALKEQRGAVEQSLDTLERLWNEQVVPLLKAFGQAFHTLTLHVTEIKPSQLDVSFLPVPNARVVVKTADLNNFLQQFPDLKGLRFTLAPGRADLSGNFGGATLQISGNFVIADQTVLRYSPEQISFAGLPVAEQYTRDLIAGGGLDFDLNQLVTGWKLTSAVVDTDTVTVKASYSP